MPYIDKEFALRLIEEHGGSAASHSGLHEHNVVVGAEAEVITRSDADQHASETAALDRTHEALKRILRMATATECTSKKVTDKLLRAGFSEAECAAALHRAQELGIIDDARYLESLIRSRLYAGKGRFGVTQEIEELGFDPEHFAEVFDEFEDDELSRALSFLEAHPPHSKNLRDGAFRKLVHRGFSFDIAGQAARLWLESVK